MISFLKEDLAVINVTDGPIIEGEEEPKSMATLLKRTGITSFAPNFSDMLFMIIEMASLRGFSDFILEAEIYAKNCPKMVILYTQIFKDLCKYLGFESKI